MNLKRQGRGLIFGFACGPGTPEKLKGKLSQPGEIVDCGAHLEILKIRNPKIPSVA